MSKFTLTSPGKSFVRSYNKSNLTLRLRNSKSMSLSKKMSPYALFEIHMIPLDALSQLRSYILS